MEKRVRTGCITCRKRRVKCDEAKPICCRCRSASVLCEGYSILRQVMCVHRSPASPFYETISFPKTSCRHLDWRQDQLLLYHHFVTTTAVRLFRDEHIRFWRDEVAQMSYKLDFVYEALRAISAIHRAVLLGRQNGNAHDAAKSRFVGIHAYSNVLGLLPSYLMPTTPIENIAILVVLVFLTYVEVRCLLLTCLSFITFANWSLVIIRQSYGSFSSSVGSNTTFAQISRA